MQSLHNIFVHFDDVNKKSFSIFDVGTMLSQLPEEDRSENYMFENTAFRLCPFQENNPWMNHFYGPECTFINADGEIICNPAKKDITIETIEYWRRRIDEVQNPLLKMHYSGLVWDFQSEIAGMKNDFNLFKSYVDSMIRVCDDDYGSHPIENIDTLKRLINLTRKNPTYLSRVKTVFESFEKRHATDTTPGFWAPRFQIMQSDKHLFTDEEKLNIITEHEERLKRLFDVTDKYQNLPYIQDQAELLAEYYYNLQQKDEVKRVLNIVEQALKDSSSCMMKMQYAANIELLARKYSSYGMSDEVKRLQILLPKAFENSKGEMQKIDIPFEIPKEYYVQAEMLYGDGANSDMERWNNFVLHFIPNKLKSEKELKENQAKYPLLSMTGTKLLDPKGRPMSEVGTIENDLEGNLAMSIAQEMNLQTCFLHIAINDIIKSGALEPEKIMDCIIKKSPIFEENRYEIIKDALIFFLKGNYVLFSHLIVPQIENAICNIIELKGGIIIKPQRSNKGYQLKTLDELLRDTIIDDVLTANGAYYLRLVLTDQRALNIRNLLCHGIVEPKYFGYGTAGRLLHVLIMLGLIRQK